MINRRSFLKTSLAGGAVMAFPQSATSLFSFPEWSALTSPLLEVAAERNVDNDPSY